MKNKRIIDTHIYIYTMTTARYIYNECIENKNDNKYTYCIVGYMRYTYKFLYILICGESEERRTVKEKNNR